MANQPPNFAEYPRPSFNFSGGRGPGVYFDAIGEAFNIVKQDIGQWIAATLIYFVLSYLISLPGSLITGGMAGSASDRVGLAVGLIGVQLIFSLVANTITNIMMVGLISMGIRKLRGEAINVGMIFDPFKDFGRLVTTSLLYFVIVFAAALACIIPALYFAPVLVLMTVVSYQRKLNATDALSLTYNACKSYWGGLLGLTIVLGIVVVLGFCACGVGALVTFPIYCVALAIHYRAFFESETAPTVAPGFTPGL